MNKASQEILGLLHACCPATANARGEFAVLHNLLKLRVGKQAGHAQAYQDAVCGMIKKTGAERTAVFACGTVAYLLQSEVQPVRDEQGGVVPPNPFAIPIFASVFSGAGAKLALAQMASLITDYHAVEANVKGPLRSCIRKATESAGFDCGTFCELLLGMPKVSEFGGAPASKRELYVVNTTETVAQVLISVAHRHQTLADYRSALEAMSRMRPAQAHTPESMPKSVHATKLLVGRVQGLTVAWLQRLVPAFFTPPKGMLTHVLRTVFFLFPAERYFQRTEGNLGAEEAIVFRLLRTDTIVAEGTIPGLARLGSRDAIPLTAPDALLLTWDLVRRAASLCVRGVASLPAADAGIIPELLQLAAYNANIALKLPDGYSPPALALTVQYWQVWKILLFLAAANPQTVGAVAWSDYPTLRVLMQMCVLSNFSAQDLAPGPDAANDAASSSAPVFSVSPDQERQLEQAEIQDILEFETLLAEACNEKPPTQQSSRLVGKVMRAGPREAARVLPRRFLDEVGRECAAAPLGIVLCRSRSPDYLGDIVKASGTSAQLTALLPLLHAENLLGQLPSSALCDLLVLERSRGRPPAAAAAGKDGELLSLLRSSTSSSAERLREVALTLLSHLKATSTAVRKAAAGILKSTLPGGTMGQAVSTSSALIKLGEEAGPSASSYFHDLTTSILAVLRVETTPEVLAELLLALLHAHRRLSPPPQRGKASTVRILVPVSTFVVDRGPVADRVLAHGQAAVSLWRFYHEAVVQWGALTRDFAAEVGSHDAGRVYEACAVAHRKIQPDNVSLRLVAEAIPDPVARVTELISQAFDPAKWAHDLTPLGVQRRIWRHLLDTDLAPFALGMLSSAPCWEVVSTITSVTTSRNALGKVLDWLSSAPEVAQGLSSAVQARKASTHGFAAWSCMAVRHLRVARLGLQPAQKETLQEVVSVLGRAADPPLSGPPAANPSGEEVPCEMEGVLGSAAPEAPATYARDRPVTLVDVDRELSLCNSEPAKVGQLRSSSLVLVHRFLRQNLQAGNVHEAVLILNRVCESAAASELLPSILSLVHTVVSCPCCCCMCASPRSSGYCPV